MIPDTTHKNLRVFNVAALLPTVALIFPYLIKDGIPIILGLTAPMSLSAFVGAVLLLRQSHGRHRASLACVDLALAALFVSFLVPFWVENDGRRSECNEWRSRCNDPSVRRYGRCFGNVCSTDNQMLGAYATVLPLASFAIHLSLGVIGLVQTYQNRTAGCSKCRCHLSAASVGEGNDRPSGDHGAARGLWDEENLPEYEAAPLLDGKSLQPGV